MILENITALCKQHNTTIAALERAVGIANGTISRWGRSSPCVDNLKKVADYFGVTVDRLLNPFKSFNEMEMDAVSVLNRVPAEKQKDFLSIISSIADLM